MRNFYNFIVLLSIFVLSFFFFSCGKRCDFPDKIYSGLQGKHHVQGIAVDKENGFIYFSFTTKLLKMDLEGNVIGSVEGITGHLGDLTISSSDSRVYASLEYKNDAIGRGIAGDAAASRGSGFYVAIFDGTKITRPGMDAARDGVMSTVYLKEVVDDYYAEVEHNGRVVKHRYGCSGIDGISFAPAWGSWAAGDSTGRFYRDEDDGLQREFLYVAYGVYGDTTRYDNDNQVILRYDVEGWGDFEQPLSEDNLHKSGPAEVDEKYFIFTGNTRYGIQNMEYDSFSGKMFAAVYPGAKRVFPNYSLFAFDWLNGELFLRGDSAEVLGQPAIEGWHFPFGATGFFPLGGGFYYISHPSGEPEQSSTVHLYKLNDVSGADAPFIKVIE